MHTKIGRILFISIILLTCVNMPMIYGQEKYEGKQNLITKKNLRQYIPNSFQAITGASLLKKPPRPRPCEVAVNCELRGIDPLVTRLQEEQIPFEIIFRERKGNRKPIAIISNQATFGSSSTALITPNLIFNRPDLNGKKMITVRLRNSSGKMAVYNFRTKFLKSK